MIQNHKIISKKATNRDEVSKENDNLEIRNCISNNNNNSDYANSKSSCRKNLKNKKRYSVKLI